LNEEAEIERSHDVEDAGGDEVVTATVRWIERHLARAPTRERPAFEAPVRMTLESTFERIVRPGVTSG
jgi:hypothetical protein